MKNYFFYLFLLIFSTINAQTFFTKTFHEYNIGSVLCGVKVFQLNDGGYILTGISMNNQIVILKADSLGNKIWSRDFKSRFWDDQNSLPVVITPEGETIIFYIKRVLLEPTERHLTKLNIHGETVWDLLVDDNESQVASDAVLSNNGDIFIVSTFMINNNYIPKLLKFDGNGNLIFSKVFNFSLFNANLCRLLWSPRNQLLLAGESTIVVLNDTGEEQWSKSLEGIIKTVSLEEDNYIICLPSETKSIISKFDYMGEIVWEKSLNGKVKNINYTPGKGYIAAIQRYSGNFLSKIDVNFDIEYEWMSWGNLAYAEETKGIGFLAIGILQSNLWIIKTNLSLEFSGIEILSPGMYSALSPLTLNNVEFLTNQVNSITIDLSTNNGKSWNQIDSNIPSSSGHYTWGILLTEQYDSCLIRISDFSNPIVTGISGMFSIKYQMDNNNYISINNVKMWISNNGMSSHNPLMDNGGYYWPRENFDKFSAIYTDGIVYGATVNNEIKVGGATYRYGWQAGPIMNNGNAADPNDIKYRIYKIRKNWESMPEGYEKSLFEYDYNNWPGDLGAPFDDLNNDGVFTKGIDLPRYLGDEQLYMISNDKDPSRSTYLYGSYPIGLEFQQLLFGFDREDGLADVIYKKIDIINKSENIIKDMYISYWADGDLGNINDDRVGCDTTLSLGFNYNADNNDEGYYGEFPPAVGHLLIQGPIVQSAVTDSARFNEKWLKGFKNLPMSSFVIYVDEFSSNIYNDPNLGIYPGTIQMYYNMQGLTGQGSQFKDPNTNQSTKYCLPGDPISGQGWFEGAGWPGGFSPGDRRYLLSSGPFTMAPGDTQEVVYAVLASKGSNNLNSISTLKKLAKEIKNFYYSDYISYIINEKISTPFYFQLFQNYPNPFNPVTKIKYQIPENGMVTLKVYDILGREVATLVDQFQKVGKYDVEFNAKGLASGVYIYKINANSFTDSKKFVLMK
ncbi:MAG: T9SS type A sorting domain-containing protein [bacterium]